MANFKELGRRVLESQPFSRFLGASLRRFEEGVVELVLEVRPEFLQQHGFVHGGVLSYLVDNALTFAGGSILGENVVTVEFKINYLRPAKGPVLLARAQSLHRGSRMAVCRAEVFEEGEVPRLVGVGQGTIARTGA